MEQHWGGGHYEVDIRLGNHSEEHVNLALETLWADPRPVVADPRAGTSKHMSGTATLPDGANVRCASIVLDLDGE